MLTKRSSMIIVAAALLLRCANVPSYANQLVIFDSHDLKLTIDVATHSATIEDSGVMQVFAGQNLFLLAPGAAIEEFTVDGITVEHSPVPATDTALWLAAIREQMPELDLSGGPMLVQFQSEKSGTLPFFIRYVGEFFQDVANTRFSNENVGAEIAATISEQGAYFSSASYYFPQGKETMAAFRLTADIPGDWESVSDGNRLSSDSTDGRKVQSWENPFRSDGVSLFAAPFVVAAMKVDSIDVACYFFPEDAQLANNYLIATSGYIKMYNELIGPYPYGRFTVAENFFPTGYGMPGWTLLGQQVLRLPFIIRTSLGHEVLHNWWGNSVFVDYEKGNWCEGLTVYGADYRYKLLQSPEEALDYRKNILKQYVSYVNEGNDFPLREFTSRSSPETRTIGYNKSMMVFHMIEEMIGSDAFFKAWKDVYSENVGKAVSWDQWLGAFEKTSGRDLSYISPQWLDRPGAPFLAAEVLDVVDEGEVREIEFRLSEQSGDQYRLKVPLRFSGPEMVIDTSVTLDGDKGEYQMKVPYAVTTLEVDPDYHLFRKLYPEEVEPVIAAVLGNPKKQFINYATAPIDRSALEEFGLNMTGDSVSILSPDEADSTGESSAVFFWKWPEYVARSVPFKEDTIYVDGTGYDIHKHTFVFAGQDEGPFDKCLAVFCWDLENLPRIGQLLPHYGKYSYLVFEGTKNVAKGQWVPEDSPLRLPLAGPVTGEKK